MKIGCLIPLVAFLVLSTAGLVYYFSQQRNLATENLITETPAIRDVTKKTMATGAIKPRQEVMIKPQVSGVVENIFVEPGAIVTKGQKLAKIKLVPSELNINSAQSSVELARLRLQEAERELARQKNLRKTDLDVEEARARLENAQQEANRAKELFSDGVISQQVYQNRQTDYNIAKAAYENAQVIANNEIKRFETALDIQQQELTAAINNLQLLREGASRNSRQVANVVLSTVDGMVLDVPVEEGSSVIERNNFNEGTSIATIADMDNLIFAGTVDESDVGKLKEGMPLVLTVGAIDDITFDANLEYISPKGVDASGTVTFEVRAAVVNDRSTFLRAGYSANADIIIDQRQQVVTVNERDVIYENDDTFLEVEKGERQFDKVPVKLGLSDGIFVEVVQGVDTSYQVRVQTGG
ncbi:MAG: efflux RND transporter periplasmic adaptor subunit [Saprospiraceae bacterium]|nr:efflux RND transporter periplasmic adaptor subunit [Saprospiraceae bacterium]